MKKVRELLKLLGFDLWGLRMSVEHFTAIQSFVKMEWFQSANALDKHRTTRPTNIALPSAMPLVDLK